MVALTSQNFHPDKVSQDFKDELDGVLTVREVCDRFSKSYKGVMLAIYTGRLYAEKRDAPEQTKGGVWLVSFKSAFALWGGKDEVYNVR